VLIIINHTAAGRSIGLPSAMKDLLSNNPTPASQIALPPHGVAVLE
jgi:hypothetical protein